MPSKTSKKGSKKRNGTRKINKRDKVMELKTSKR